MKRPVKLTQVPQDQFQLPSIQRITSNKQIKYTKQQLYSPVRPKGKLINLNQARLENTQSVVDLKSSKLISQQQFTSETTTQHSQALQNNHSTLNIQSKYKVPNIVVSQTDSPSTILRPQPLKLLQRTEKRPSKLGNQQIEYSLPQVTLMSKKRSTKLSIKEAQQMLASKDLQRASLVRSSIQSLSDQSGVDHDEFDIWDNQDLFVRGINIEDINQIDQTQRMLKLYKIRYAQFPLQKEPIANELVIKSVKKIAGTNRKVYRKYFKPGEEINFQDNEDYSQSADVRKDQNFKRFQEYTQFRVNPSKPNRVKA